MTVEEGESNPTPSGSGLGYLIIHVGGSGLGYLILDGSGLGY